jgi:endoglucanase Acf2
VATDLAIPVPGPGRKSKYQPDFADQARKLCLLGAVDEELADFFGVCIATIYNWQNEHPAFLEAIRAGKVKADAEVADSLYKRATGEYVQLEKLMKKDDGSFEAVRYKSYIPGDPNAAFRWLLNRRRQNWSDKAQVELSGNLTVTKVERVIVDPANPDS